MEKTANHGTYAAYVRGCRCDKCRAAARLYHQKHRQKLVEEKRLTHGKVSSYNAGCRCEKCRRASTTYRRERRQRSE